MTTANIGKRIAKLRKEKGATQKELADYLCVTDKAVSRWESGVGNPDIDFLPKIAEFFGVSLDYLVLGKENKNEEKANVVEEQPVEQPVERSKKKLSKKRIIILCSIIGGLVVLAGGGFGIAAGVIENKNSSTYSKAIKLMESGDYNQAIGILGSIKSYKDSSNKIEVCYGLISIDNSREYNDYSLLKEGITRIVGAKESIDATYDGNGRAISEGSMQFTSEISLLNPGIYEPSIDSFTKWNVISSFYLKSKTTLFLSAVWSD